MVYIEHEAAEPVIARRQPEQQQRWPTKRDRHQSGVMRWFLIGVAAAAVVYVALLIVGWQGVSGLLRAISL